ncbi:RING/U-box superfamily protein [Artemisia annua]|uniref:RING/U-box superfamily protein n=1 Tax=Artemisia annua TaxID=35608 RepID=A0A2U1ME13_ARTAN|nr:RING/U-box superfamily protein [Artemisia annua]
MGLIGPQPPSRGWVMVPHEPYLEKPNTKGFHTQQELGGIKIPPLHSKNPFPFGFLQEGGAFRFNTESSMGRSNQLGEKSIVLTTVGTRDASYSACFESVWFCKLEFGEIVEDLCKNTLLVIQKIAKTGSLCCVAARPHGSNAASRDWSMGPHEPYWRTNTSFSPPPRWDIRYHSEVHSFGSQEGSQLYRSSMSSNSRESMSWSRGNYLPNHQHSASDGVGPDISSLSDFSPNQQWIPPTVQEISVDEFGNSSRRVLGPSSYSPTIEVYYYILYLRFRGGKRWVTLDLVTSQNGSLSKTCQPGRVKAGWVRSTHNNLPVGFQEMSISAAQDSRVSMSSRSDSSDYDPIAKSQSSHRNYTSGRCFMFKPVHPITFPPEKREGPAIPDFDETQRDRQQFSSPSCDFDITDESDSISRPSVNQSYAYKCCLCERFLSQSSPWSSRRIVRSGDMPVTGVLSCRHVFHAECLDQTTPKVRKGDPPCPVCAKSDEESSPDQRIFSKMRNGFPKLRPFREDGPSRPWVCGQAGNCAEGALSAPPRNAMLLINKNRVKKSLSLKGNSSNSSKELPGVVGSLKRASGFVVLAIFEDSRFQKR